MNDHFSHHLKLVLCARHIFNNASKKMASFCCNGSESSTGLTGESHFFANINQAIDSPIKWQNDDCLIDEV